MADKCLKKTDWCNPPQLSQHLTSSESILSSTTKRPFNEIAIWAIKEKYGQVLKGTPEENIAKLSDTSNDIGKRNPDEPPNEKQKSG